MRLVDHLKMFGRFAVGLPAHLRLRLTVEEAEATVRQRMAEREPNFLRVMRRGVYENARSPYFKLLGRAGCEYADLEQMVRDDGLEPTLERLADAGVYVSFEELKGRRPIVRDGFELPVSTADFENPWSKRHYETETGGSTGAGTRVGIDLEYLASRAPQNCLWEHVHGLLDAPRAYYWPGLPGHAINSLLTRFIYGSVPDRWFDPVPPADVKQPYRAANALVPRLMRLAGVPVPSAETVPIPEAHRVARWVHDTLEREGRCVLHTSVGLGVRIAIAAEEHGLSLRGAMMTVGSEPPTSAKVGVLEAAGVRVFPGYHMAELAPVALGCGHPVEENDLHVMQDQLAVITVPRELPGQRVEVDTLTFTSLLPTAHMLLLNYVSDDYGVLERRTCGCGWEAYGFDLHVRSIRSRSKLCSESVTIVGSDMEKLIDTDLPGRFGGRATDYQLVEEEDERGLTRLSLLIDPGIEIADEDAVVDYVFACLEPVLRGQPVEKIWRDAGTLRIVRQPPTWTARAKLMPLVKSARATRRSHTA